MLKTDKQANHFSDYVKCKSEDSRKILMEIIYHLHEISAEEDPNFIDDYILPIFNGLPNHKKKIDTKSSQVGLVNLGSTCYMNSMLQLINSVAPFRNLIMQANSTEPLVR
jgi:ubiquitin C-terminal hydrolase